MVADDRSAAAAPISEVASGRERRRVDVVVPVYHPGPWLEPCMRSALTSRGVRARVIAVRNDALPPDPEFGPPEVMWLAPGRNMGFAAACNLAINASDAPWILCLNQDARLESDTLRSLVLLLEADPGLGSVGPKVLRLSEAVTMADGHIDTLGLAKGRAGRFVDIAQGEPDDGTGGVRDVFGVSAAVALYRRTALEAVVDEHGIFDERFFMYKEDVDLAWRLRRCGYRAAIDADAVAYHGRSIRRARSGHSAFAAEREKPSWVRRQSWRNQALLVIKNEQPGRFLRELPIHAAREIALLAVGLVSHPVDTITTRVSAVPELIRAAMARAARPSRACDSTTDTVP